MSTAAPAAWKFGWRETQQRLAEDRARIRSMIRAQYGFEPHLLLIDPAYQAALLYRISHYLWRNGSGKLSRLFSQLNTLVTGVDINPVSDLGGGLWIPAPAGVSVAGHAGRNLCMAPTAGIGMTPDLKDIGAGPGQPMIGDDVVLGPWSGVLGPVSVGDEVWLHPACSAFRNIPENTEVRLAIEPYQTSERWTAPEERPCENACHHRRLSASWSDYHSDVKKYIERLRPYRGRRAGTLRWLGAFTSTQAFATGLYRLSHLFHARGWRVPALLICWTNLLLNKITIPPQTCIGPRLFLPHPVGVVIHAHVGSGAVFYARTLCSSHAAALFSHLGQAPVLGDDVILTGHSAILGPVRVGDNVRLSSGVCLSRDAPSDVAVASAILRVQLSLRSPQKAEWPATIGSRDNQTNRRNGLRSPSRTNASQLEPISWKDTRSRLEMDRHRLWNLAEQGQGLRGWKARMTLLFPSYTCAWLSRLSHHFFQHGYPWLARRIWHLNLMLTGADIAPWSDLGGGLYIPHPVGVSVQATAGRNLTVMALSTIGPAIEGYADPGARVPYPVIGDDVYVGHACGIHGNVGIGNGVHLVAGSFLGRDVADGVTVHPPRIRLQRFSSNSAD